jgi:hypothetical protein
MQLNEQKNKKDEQFHISKYHLMIVEDDDGLSPE